MIEAMHGLPPQDGGLRAQVGKLLCCSETIYPEGSKRVADAMVPAWMGGEKALPSRNRKPAAARGTARGGEPRGGGRDER